MKLFKRSLPFFGASAGLLVAFMVYLLLSLPSVESIKSVEMQVPLRIYTLDGKLMNAYGEKRRMPVTLPDIPQDLIDAFIATEDQRFYQHGGVDIMGLFRASAALIQTGKKVQGASTITMQVARNFYLSRNKTFARKIHEILLALKIEHALNKQKILALYLNKIYLGQRAYGVAAAAQIYYGKSLDQLSLAQKAMLAGLPKAPSSDNPITNPERALKRRAHVLSRMLENHFITPQAYLIAKQAPITATPHGYHIEVDAPYVSEMARSELVQRYGKAAYTMGLNVYTTIHSGKQIAANQALKSEVRAYSKRHGFRGPAGHLSISPELWQTALKNDYIELEDMWPAAVSAVANKTVVAQLSNGRLIDIPWNGLSWARRQLNGGFVSKKPNSAEDILNVGDVIYVAKNEQKKWELTQLPEAQSALVSLNPKDGAILALVGGYSNRMSRFNRATQAQRQSGSSFKPFIYSAALEQGMTLASIINDAPIVMQDNTENGAWRPHNHTYKFHGPTRLRDGLIHSRNLVSIRLLQKIGISQAQAFLKRFDFSPDAIPASLSLALGSGTLTPLDLSISYATFANGGFKITPHIIHSVIDEKGNVLFQARPKIACAECILEKMGSEQADQLAPRVISIENAFLMTKLLQDAIQNGTGRRAKSLNRKDIAGKTGTTNDRIDGWFAGFNGDIVTVVWTGFDQPKSLHEYGSQFALPIWVSYMSKALAGSTLSSLKRPATIVNARIDPYTGYLAEASQKDAIFEYFRKDHLPSLPNKPTQEANDMPLF